MHYASLFCLYFAIIFDIGVYIYFKPGLAVLKLNIYFNCTVFCLLEAVAFTLRASGLLKLILCRSSVYVFMCVFARVCVSTPEAINN